MWAASPKLLEIREQEVAVLRSCRRAVSATSERPVDVHRDRMLHVQGDTGR